MSNFFTPRRFSFAGFVFAVVVTLALQGTLLMGFDQIATQGEQGQATATRWAKAAPGLRNVTLEPVLVVTQRRA